MSYRCGLCKAQVEPGQDAIRVVTQIRDVIYVNLDEKYPNRTGKRSEIAKEHIICPDCLKGLGPDFQPEVTGSVTRELHMTRSRFREEKEERRSDRDLKDFRDFDL